MEPQINTDEHRLEATTGSTGLKGGKVTQFPVGPVLPVVVRYSLLSLAIRSPKVVACLSSVFICVHLWFRLPSS